MPIEFVIRDAEPSKLFQYIVNRYIYKFPMNIQISHDQMVLLLESLGNQLDTDYSEELFSLYLRLLIQAKEEGINISELKVHA